MSQSTHRTLFGSLSGVGRGPAVTVIDHTVHRIYLRKARISFFVVGGVVALLSATVASSEYHPILGLFLGLLIGTVCGALVAAFIAAWPVLRVFWHWAIEISLGLAVIYGWTVLMQVTTTLAALLVVASLVGIPAVIGPIRRRIVAYAWCVIVRHRLRLCFASFIRGTGYTLHHGGCLPLILAAWPTPAGERVWIWLRPGLALSDLEGRTDKLAVACWASEVRVARSGSRAALIRVDITRRNPLTAAVDSPLPNLIPEKASGVTPVSPEKPPAALDLPDVPDSDAELVEAVTRARAPRGNIRTESAENTASASAVDDVDAFI